MANTAPTTDKPASDPATGGGIVDTITSTVNQGVDYLQSAVTGTSSTGSESESKETSGGVPSEQEGSSSSTSIGAKTSEIGDEHVSEFIRDKYKSKPGEWPEEKKKGDGA